MTTAMPALANAACRASGFDSLTATDAEIDAAKSHCLRCWDRPECLAWGLKNEDSGLWGGHDAAGLQRLRTEFGIEFHAMTAAAYTTTRRSSKTKQKAAPS